MVPCGTGAGALGASAAQPAAKSAIHRQEKRRIMAVFCHRLSALSSEILGNRGPPRVSPQQLIWAVFAGVFMAHSYDVVGLGNAIVDIIASVDDRFLLNHRIAKGGMTLIDEFRAKELLKELADNRQALSGLYEI